MFVEWMSELEAKRYREKSPSFWYLDNRFGCWSNDKLKKILGTPPGLYGLRSTGDLKPPLPTQSTANKMADLIDKLFEEIQWWNQVFLGNFFFLKLFCKAWFHESQQISK